MPKTINPRSATASLPAGMTIRRGGDRGHFDHGWLNTYHTFSFAGYHDPNHRGFRNLRVINEDRVQAGQGFGTHGHRDMEIVSYVLDGQLAHRDSLGSGSTLEAGMFQRMTAGSGIQHSEFNPSPDRLVHFYQIWIRPTRRSLPPSYEDRRFDDSLKIGRWLAVATPAHQLTEADRANGTMEINADATIRVGVVPATSRDATDSSQEAVAAEEPDGASTSLPVEVAQGRGAWLQVTRGTVELAGVTLDAGDGVAIDRAMKTELRSDAGGEVLWLDIA